MASGTITFDGERIDTVNTARRRALSRDLQVTTSPRHPYTRTLLLSAPVADVAEQRRRREQRMTSAGQLPG